MPGFGRFEEMDIWEQTDSNNSNGYDGLLYSEQIESALENEAEDSLNAQLYRDEQKYLNESPKRKQLKYKNPKILDYIKSWIFARKQGQLARIMLKMEKIHEMPLF